MRVHRFPNIFNLSALLCGLLLVATGCGVFGSSGANKVSGDTGMCTESGTVWSGDPPPGGILPGSVLERDVDCTGRSMSDTRLSGDTSIHLRCEFTEHDGSAVGECDAEETTTNEHGTWTDPHTSMTITVTPGEPSKITEDGVQIGSGDYEGLRFVFHVEGTGSDYPWPISGILEPLK